MNQPDERPNRGQPREPSWAVIAIILTAALAAAAFYVMSNCHPEANLPPIGPLPQAKAPTVAPVGYERFVSDQEVRDWLAQADEAGGAYGYGGMGVMTMRSAGMVASDVGTSALLAPSAPGAANFGEAAPAPTAAPDRYSTTNVQVAGIDEPDMVKTDGNNLFYSPEQRYGFIRPMPMIEGSVGSTAMPVRPVSQPGVRAAQVFPVASLKNLAQLDRRGDLLLAGSVLLVLAPEGVFAYDVSDAAKPQAKWSYLYQNGAGLVTARLLNGQLYLVTQTSLNRNKPCPVVPLSAADRDLTVPCTEIWHPSVPVATDATFVVAAINPATGDATHKTAFVGSSSGTVVYVSPKNIYLAAVLPPDALNFMVGFFQANPGLAPAEVVRHLAAVAGYDLSENAKQVEMQMVMSRWVAGLDDDARLQLGNDLTNRFRDYWDGHAREFQRSVVTRLAADTLEVAATGEVPGTLLNQFSMDEDGGYLRLAVTIGGRGGIGWPFDVNSNQSVSDVYVLDGQLKTVGTVSGLGQGERIYAVRFLGDRGYVVTFKETDPLYVLDLSQPTKPVLTGQLQLPGYSAYLHPLPDGQLLGIGKDGSQVKISLFDVSDAAKPVEKAKYSLDEYWTDIMGTHHAFLLDDQHHVFFMPGSKGGYVFSYEGDQLAMVKAVADARVQRAIYINDNLYLVGDERIVVLDEKSWTKTAELDWSNL